MTTTAPGLAQVFSVDITINDDDGDDDDDDDGDATIDDSD